MKTQFATADFEEGTWTFKMDMPFKVYAGNFAIVDKDNYDELLRTVRSLRLSIGAHPDCTEDSEFQDMVDSADEIYKDCTGEDLL